MVYAERRWWDVDATADGCDGVNFSTSDTDQVEHLDFDGTDAFRERFYVTADRVLRYRTADPYSCKDKQPGLTEIVKELLVSGSTK